jgi:integrase
MLFHIIGLTKRGGVWQYRRTITPKLRPVLGQREIVESLRTGDEVFAQARWREVHARVERMFKEAANGASPSVAAYTAVRGWKSDVNTASGSDTSEDGLDFHLTEDTIVAPSGQSLPREVRDALLNRRESKQDDSDNPPLSLLFASYFAERNLPAKTVREWKGVLRHFTVTLGADLPVRSITQAHVRSFKVALLASKLHPKTAQKLLSALRAVFSWAKKQGYVQVNVADGITQLATKENDEERRLPFTVEQARAILDKLPSEGHMRWLWLIALYSGARLAEIAGLRREDVREHEGVLCFDIRPHEGRSLKNKSSRRTVPVHPEILQAGFTAGVLPFKSKGHYYSKRVNPWLRSVVGITDPRLSFHSARHTVKDRLRAARAPEHEGRALMGHGATGVADSYGLGYPMTVLADAVAKIK